MDDLTQDPRLPVRAEKPGKGVPARVAGRVREIEAKATCRLPERRLVRRSTIEIEPLGAPVGFVRRTWRPCSRQLATLYGRIQPFQQSVFAIDPRPASRELPGFHASSTGTKNAPQFGVQLFSAPLAGSGSGPHRMAKMVISPAMAGLWRTVGGIITSIAPLRIRLHTVQLPSPIWVVRRFVAASSIHWPLHRINENGRGVANAIVLRKE